MKMVRRDFGGSNETVPHHGLLTFVFVRPHSLGIGVAATLFLAAGSALCQTRSHPRHNAEFQNDLVRRLVGMRVENDDGEKLGVIKDFVMDMQSGQAKYGLIASSGIIGIGSHLKIAPAQSLSTATAKKGVVSLDVGKRRWANAPVFRNDDLLKFSDPAWSKRIAQFYGQAPPGAGAVVSTPAAVALPPPSKGHEPRHEAPVSPPGSFAVASGILGKLVLSRQQETIGEISDLLVDLGTQRQAFAIIAYGKSSNHEKTFAIPLRSLSVSARNKFMLDADRKMFAEAKPFDEQSWPTSSTNRSEMIYEFGDKQ